MYNFFESLMFWYSHVIHKLSSEKKNLISQIHVMNILITEL